MRACWVGFDTGAAPTAYLGQVPPDLWEKHLVLLRQQGHDLPGEVHHVLPRRREPTRAHAHNNSRWSVRAGRRTRKGRG
jgi:hypothetical protein